MNKKEVAMMKNVNMLMLIFMVGFGTGYVIDLHQHTPPEECTGFERGGCFAPTPAIPNRAETITICSDVPNWTEGDVLFTQYGDISVFKCVKNASEFVSWNWSFLPENGWTEYNFLKYSDYKKIGHIDVSEIKKSCRKQ